MPYHLISSLFSVALSLSAIVIWARISRLNRGLFSVAIWPLSWLISVVLFNAVVVIDLFVFDFATPQALNYWASGLILHAIGVLMYGARVMFAVFNHRR